MSDCSDMNDRAVKACGGAERKRPIEVYWYDVDAEDRMVAASENWSAFASCNGATELTIEAIRGKPIWQYIADPVTRSIYRDLFGQVRRTKRSILIPYRCDSPDERREMELEIAASADKGLHIESRVLRTEPQDTGTVLRDDKARDDRMIEACSFCKKINMAERGWMETSDAAQSGGVFSERTIPQLSHSVCPTCEPELQRRLEMPST